MSDSPFPESTTKVGQIVTNPARISEGCGDAALLQSLQGRSRQITEGGHLLVGTRMDDPLKPPSFGEEPCFVQMSASAGS